MRLPFIVLFLCAFIAQTSYCNDSIVCHISDIGGHYREHNVDFDTLKLDIRFNPLLGEVSGKELLSFKPIQPIVDSLFLDAPGITFNSIMINDPRVNITFSTTKEGVSIRFSKSLNWNRSYKITIDYKATPRRGLYFIGWKDERNLSRKQIWTQGQGIDNRHWFPCYDDVNDKVITETNITFDKAYTVISNGLLTLSRINPDNTKTWQYRMSKPHSPYLVMLAIDKYAYKDYPSKSGITSRQYYYADRPQDVASTYQYSSEMMDWLRKELQVPFPWTSYANTPVQDFMFGAMENTTSTIFGDFYLHDYRANQERGYVSTNAHELTHQWFGDYITEWSATHHWLHESFATYYAKQFCATVYGQDQYEWTKYNESLQAINADKNDNYPVAHSRAGSSRHYPKGSFVIDMLRYVVGDSIYRKCITKYLEKHAYGMVDTHDFYRAFMETAGINLDWFFEEWIYKSGVPEFTVAYQTDSSAVRIFVAQTHKKDSLIKDFRMPVDIEVYTQNGEKIKHRFLISRTLDTFSIPVKANTQTEFVVFDPGYNVLKTLKFQRSYNELIAQAAKSKNMIDRYLAIVALKDTAVARKQSDLIKMYESEKAIYIKQEIIAQLGKAHNEEAKKLLVKGLKEEHFMVRRAVVESIDTIDTELIPELEKMLNDTSYVNIEMALRKLEKQFPNQAKVYFEKTKEIHGISENVRIAWLELQIKEASNPLMKELVEYTSLSYEFRTRLRAMESLQRVGFYNEQLVINLVDASLNPNARLAGPAERTITKFVKEDTFKTILTNYISSKNWENWQSEILAKWKK